MKTATNNGRSLPMLGLGVYKITEQAQMSSAVQCAWDAGYRLFDTAQMYGNEALLGTALSPFHCFREQYFLTSKLDPSNSSDPAASLHRSLRSLQTDYVDIFMIHWPGQQQKRLLRVWAQLEDLCLQGKIRTLGVCNCTPQHLHWILDNCRIPPAVHQVEHHPLLNETDLYDLCRSRNICLQAWAPLMRGNLDLPVLQELSDRYRKSPAQILLRWNVQQGFSVIPKSVRRDRIFENADIFDFSLSAEDMVLLDSMHTGQRSGKDPFTYDY